MLAVIAALLAVHCAAEIKPVPALNATAYLGECMRRGVAPNGVAKATWLAADCEHRMHGDAHQFYFLK